MAETGGVKGFKRRSYQAERSAQLHTGGSEGIQETERLEDIPCPGCSGVANQVINAGNKTRVGWYCGMCRYFKKAKVRERML